MRLLVASDLHGSETAAAEIHTKSLECKANLVVICGDITHFGSVGQAEKLLRKISVSDIPVLFVPGNCDSPSLISLTDLEGIHNIHGCSRIVDGICFGGIGGSSPSPFNTPFELSEERICQILDGISFDSVGCSWRILVSHSPPLDTSLDRTRFGLHVGSRSVRGFIEKEQPDLILCGHIHESRGKDHLGGSVIVNPGSARHGSYAVVNLTEEIHILFEDFR